MIIVLKNWEKGVFFTSLAFFSAAKVNIDIGFLIVLFEWRIISIKSIEIEIYDSVFFFCYE